MPSQKSSRHPWYFRTLLLVSSTVLSIGIILSSLLLMPKDSRIELGIVDPSNPQITTATYKTFSVQERGLSMNTNNDVNDITKNDTKTNTSNSTIHVPVVSICLLLKDDNDILNEWIAYHYHALNVRHIIVAHDPDHTTSPSSIFNIWRDKFHMTIDEWNDQDYMPDYFFNNPDRIPSFLPTAVTQNISSSRWHVGITNKTQIQQDLNHINTHRFRQVTFLSKCMRSLKYDYNRTWMVHIDTDEYIVLNPVLRSRPMAVSDVYIPERPYASSVIQFLEAMFVVYPKRLERQCLMMPSVLFGAFEDNNNTASSTATENSAWNPKRFETLRWRYHNSYDNVLNGLQKAMLDVSALPDAAPVLQTRAHSVHQPSKESCRQMTLYPNMGALRLFPLAVYHYVGSRERYFARPDVRRTEKNYMEKASVKSGGKDDEWITGWVDEFVREHGMEKAFLVLKEYHV